MVFDRHVLTLDITCFAEGVAERGHVACHRIGRSEVYEPDDGHRRLLRARRERPRDRSAAEQRDELAALHCCSHSINSSAMASSFSGILRPSAFAVQRLMTSSNLVGCMTGRSAGLAPFRIWPV